MQPIKNINTQLDVYLDEIRNDLFLRSFSWFHIVYVSLYMLTEPEIVFTCFPFFQCLSRFLFCVFLLAFLDGGALLLLSNSETRLICIISLFLSRSFFNPSI